MSKASELRGKSAEDLEDMLQDLRKEQFNLRMQYGTGTLEGPHQLRKVRRNIARVKTVLHQIQEERA